MRSTYKVGRSTRLILGDICAMLESSGGGAGGSADLGAHLAGRQSPVLDSAPSLSVDRDARCTGTLDARPAPTSFEKFLGVLVTDRCENVVAGVRSDGGICNESMPVIREGSLPTFGLFLRSILIAPLGSVVVRKFMADNCLTGSDSDIPRALARPSWYSANCLYHAARTAGSDCSMHWLSRS